MGYPPAARLLHYHGHPNLLLDPTQLFPPAYKNTTSLSDMLLSHGFLWRYLNATVPTVTLSLDTEAPQSRGPVGSFSVNEAGCRRMLLCQLLFTHFISFTHKPHILYSYRLVCITLIVVENDYYRVLVTL